MPVESTGNTRFLGDISKGPITVILVKKAFTDIGYKEIDKPVVIIVGSRTAGSPPEAGKARCLGNIGKGSIAVILVKIIVVIAERSRCSGLQFFQSRTVDYVNVQESIVVIIKPANPTSVGLDHGRFLRPAADCDSVNPGSGADLTKLNFRLQLGRGFFGCLVRFLDGHKGNPRDQKRGDPKDSFHYCITDNNPKIPLSGRRRKTNFSHGSNWSLICFPVPAATRRVSEPPEHLRNLLCLS